MCLLHHHQFLLLLPNSYPVRSPFLLSPRLPSIQLLRWQCLPSSQILTKTPLNPLLFESHPLLLWRLPKAVDVTPPASHFRTRSPITLIETWNIRNLNPRTETRRFGMIGGGLERRLPTRQSLPSIGDQYRIG